MTKHDRIGNVLVWLIILWAFVWLCLFGIPQIIDDLSHNEDAWAREFGDSVSVKLSEGD